MERKGAERALETGRRLTAGEEQKSGLRADPRTRSHRCQRVTPRRSKPLRPSGLHRGSLRTRDLADLPRVPLLFGPSPVHPLPRLSAALGGTVEIWAKS